MAGFTTHIACIARAVATRVRRHTCGTASIPPSPMSGQEESEFRLVTAHEARIPCLFRYQPFDPARLRKILCDRSLYFSNPAAFNDPWDCRPWFDVTVLDTEGGVKRYVDWYVEITKKHGPALPEDELLRRAEVYRSDPALLRAKIAGASSAIELGVQERYRIYCLGGVGDSELMWAHYAAKHSGIVIVFSTRNEVFSGALQVFYRTTYPLYDLASAGDDALGALLIKSAAWNYEREFRLIAEDSKAVIAPDTLIATDHIVAMPAGCVVAVIVGCLAPDSTVATIREIIRESGEGIELKRAVRARDQYKLMLVDA